MSQDIRKVNDMESLMTYFSEKLNWDVDPDDFYDIDDITYDFEAEDLGLKEEAFAKISSLKQLRPLVDGQKWGIFFVEFDSKRFEVSALRKILSGLIPTRRNSADHAVWDMSDLLFLCTWGQGNTVTIGAAHFEDHGDGLPQIKMISCEPAVEDFTQINRFEQRLSKLHWPSDPDDTESWQEQWSSAFTVRYRQVIQDSHTLTVRLAEEAQHIRNLILEILEIETQKGYVHQLFEKFKQTLIHDMTESQFADMYAQTIVYGLFSARCMDASQEDFSAIEAVNCIPNTNPFLKSLMQECLSTKYASSALSFDELQISNIVELLRHTKTDAIVADFNRRTGGGREDPVIQFYEEFLDEYDKTQKVQRGVYYTPQPVVDFIIRAVDDILKTELGIADGVASTETKQIKILRQSKKKNKNGLYSEVEDTEIVPAVQILDPATGTGTFLRQTILQIYHNFCTKHKNCTNNQLRDEWNAYVPKHLLPRLNGFELMMAPYAVAHMKLAMVLKDTGYSFCDEERLQVYLTNSLEEPGDSDIQTSLFSDPLAMESVEANAIKKNKGINIIIGNPPYSCESSNQNKWIQSLMEDFKKEPGKNIKLQEQNYKAINDDYVKFIRYALSYCSSASRSIVAFINPHGFLDNPTFRGMRWNILNHFNRLYIIDLHGDARRKEKCPDGSKDENVFDIQQGVSIFIGVKEKTSHSDCKVYRYDLFGTRAFKYNWLNSNHITSINWQSIHLQGPYYFFEERQLDSVNNYNSGFSVSELFQKNVMGVATARDSAVISMNYHELENRFKRVADSSISNDVIAEELFPGKPQKANISMLSNGWSLTTARKTVDLNSLSRYIHPVCYRPFDKRYIFYHPDWIDRDRSEIMDHFISKENYGLCLVRISRDSVYCALITDEITDKTVISSKDNANVFPLYIYQSGGFGQQCTDNFSKEIIKKISDMLAIPFSSEKESHNREYFTALNVLDYVYAVLYSTSYRKKYADFIRSEFPRIPYPVTSNMFWSFAEFGRRLREIHLLKSSELHPENYEFCGDGNNLLEKANYKNGSIFINKNQYFSGVNETLWNEYIGAYQPLQKWSKDRKGSLLDAVEIEHFQKMISALKLTQEIMNEIEDFYSFN